MASNAIVIEDAITLLAEQATSHGVGLTRTKLVKLLYFVDLRAWERLGHTVTGVEWLWHHYGPYSSSIVEACDRMATNGELHLFDAQNYYGSPEHRIKAEKSLYFTPPSQDLVSVVRSVVVEFGHYSPARIGDLSYDTEPMKRLVQSGHRGDPIEFEAREPSRSDVQGVIRRYSTLIQGSRQRDEGDVSSGLREELEALDEPRRSAGSRTLRDP